jgi:hypothetical protein
MENLREFQKEMRYCIVCEHWDKERKQTLEYGGCLNCPCKVSGKLKTAMDTCGDWKENSPQKESEPLLPGIDIQVIDETAMLKNKKTGKITTPVPNDWADSV